MELLVQIMVALILSAALSVFAYYFRMLTPAGTLASFATGAVVGVFSSIEWLILLILFTLTGLAVTKLDFKKKKSMGLQEGEHGERDHRNVLGVGLPPCAIAVLSWILGDGYSPEMTILFIGTMCVAAADTVSSEMGVKDSKVWLITTFKRVTPGTDGGISVRGTLAGAAASAAMAIIGWIMIYGTLDVYVVLPMIAGILGNFLDSILGATAETKGYISKYTNNCLTALMGSALALAIYIAMF